MMRTQHRRRGYFEASGPGVPDVKGAMAHYGAIDSSGLAPPRRRRYVCVIFEFFGAYFVEDGALLFCGA
jgi:hypothetical protein